MRFLKWIFGNKDEFMSLEDVRKLFILPEGELINKEYKSE